MRTAEAETSQPSSKGCLPPLVVVWMKAGEELETLANVAVETVEGVSVGVDGRYPRQEDELAVRGAVT